MADVFLSYARGDRAVAERLAHAISDSGLTVWWDRHIKGGAQFSHDIERQLDAAARVLVLWSKDAVDSRWVRDEASVAADSERLVSATIDGTPPPLGFRQFQTIDLKGWAAKGTAIPPDLAEALEVETPAAAPPKPAPAPRRRLIAAGIGAVLLAGAATVAVVRPAPFDRLLSDASQSEGVALAIMPFVTQGGNGNEYVGAGLSTALADSLAPLSGLRITASTSTQALTGKGLTAPDIAKRLGITHLVEGNVQQSGERYSISVRLIEAGTSEQIWARSLETPAEGLQRAKKTIARELAGALRARLGVGGEVVERRDVHPRAYEAYLKALERLSVRDHPGARLEAIKQFRLASTLQPDFADAHAGHAYLLSLTSPYALGMSWNELAAVQRRSVARALELDPNNALALVARASALHNFEGEIDQATAIAQAVLKRSRNLAPAHYTLAGSLWMRGQAREALHHLDVAIEQDPLDSILRYYRAKILYSMGDYGGVRDAAQGCPDPCVGIAWVWFRAMLGHGTEGDYREDFPSFEERVRGDVSPQELAESRSVAEAFIFGRPIKLTPLKDERAIDFIEAALEARNGNFEKALRFARTAADRQQPDNVLEILNDGRVTFTPEQRADPRYHELFRHPKLIGIATARRKEGVTAGLPVFPVKPYVGR